jgi:hypothetical protein
MRHARAFRNAALPAGATPPSTLPAVLRDHLHL